MSGFRIGVLAEDITDCEALGVLIRRIVAEVCSRSVGIDGFSEKGCCRIPRKAKAKISAMANNGCSGAVIVRDLDRDHANNELNDEARLRKMLEEAIPETAIPRLICIPIEELEAWFWSDQAVLDEVGNARAHENPHLIRQPKEQLERASKGANKRPRYSTAQNKELAAILNLSICAARCKAFAEMRRFVSNLAAEAATM